MQFLTYLGAAYLLWLGVRVARARSRSRARTRARSRLYVEPRQRLNPKGVLLFFAVLPQFVTRTAACP